MHPNGKYPMDTDLLFMSATDLAEAIRNGRVSPVEAVDAVLEGIDRLNPSLNAFCTVTGEYAREMARKAEAAVMNGEPLGPLHGVPVSIKDIVITNGVRTTRGSKRYEWYVPDEDAPVVKRLKNAGAIMVGKTTTPELGWKATTDSLIFGITRNPWNTDRTPGGSSGGAAAAVASGLGPLAVGTDGGGSIRIPASFCGIYGLKPSFGRVPYYPPSAVEPLSHAGPMTRTVRDAALMLSAIAGPFEKDRNTLPADTNDYNAAVDENINGLKIAWSPDLGYATVDPEVADLTAQAAQVFETCGAHVQTMQLDLEDPIGIFTNLWLGGLWTALGPDLEEWKDRTDPGLVAFMMQGEQIDMTDYVDATFRRTHYWHTIQPIFETYDILLTPTLAVPAFETGIETPLDTPDTGVPWTDWTPFTYPFNLTGQPAATVPCGWTADGLPVGLQIIGRRYDDATVLRASAAFEGGRPWQDRKPPIVENLP